MYYGDDIVVSKAGLRIRPKALEPLGIMNNSICWGIDIPPSNKNSKDQNLHLIISPIHPTTWHRLFRVTIGLDNARGMLAKVTKVISENLKLNILSSQSAPSGHNHATFYLIAQITKDTRIPNYSAQTTDSRAKYFIPKDEEEDVIHSAIDEFKNADHLSNIKKEIKDVFKDILDEFTSRTPEIAVDLKVVLKRIFESFVENHSDKTFNKDLRKYIDEVFDSFTNNLSFEDLKKSKELKERKIALLNAIRDVVKEKLENSASPFNKFRKKIRKEFAQEMFRFSRHIEKK